MSVIKSSQEILFTDENGLNYQARIKSDITSMGFTDGCQNYVSFL
jgi:hypothetical protein